MSAGRTRSDDFFPSISDFFSSAIRELRMAESAKKLPRLICTGAHPLFRPDGMRSVARQSLAKQAATASLLWLNFFGTPTA